MMKKVAVTKGVSSGVIESRLRSTKTTDETETHFETANILTLLVPIFVTLLLR
jgi:hypothetical protein